MAKKLSQVVDKLEDLYDGKAPSHDQQCDFDDGYFTGIDVALKILRAFIEEEEKMTFPPDFEDEVDKWFDILRDENGYATVYGLRCSDWKNSDYAIDHPSFVSLARKFYNLGERAREVAISENFDNEFCDTVEKIEKKFQSEGYKTWSQEDLEELARHFAEWQYQKDSNTDFNYDVVFWKGMKYAAEQMKREEDEMMKGAVEGYVCAAYPAAQGNIIEYSVKYPKDKHPYKFGDKVKLIIVKEED